ncbi:MAG: hypothetical protein R3C11_11635 [Planctomycetaceae bacterium]
MTASGGPFRGWKKDQLEQVTPEMALDHPTWNMGPKNHDRFGDINEQGSPRLSRRNGYLTLPILR